jgi:hypothetical protein
MPTYQNDSTAARNVVNTSNKLVWVKPGETVQTYQLLTADGWTKASDSPYYNPVLAVHSTISSTGSDDPTTISLEDDCDQVEIWNNSDADITVLLNAAANTPGYEIPANTLRTLTGLFGYVDTIVLEFSAAVSSGEVIVHELEG